MLSGRLTCLACILWLGIAAAAGAATDPKAADPKATDPKATGAAAPAAAGAVPAGTPPLVETSRLCTEAADAAAARHRIPRAMMRAITLVETRRRLGETSGPWPWTLNIAGSGYWHATRADALAHAERALAEGKRSIDLGCFQLNYRWHGGGFSGPAAMLEPALAADYAASFLAGLHAETGNWMRAAGLYHSRTPVHAMRYRGLVRRTLARAGTTPEQLAALAGAPLPADATPAGPGRADAGRADAGRAVAARAVAVRSGALPDVAPLAVVRPAVIRTAAAGAVAVAAAVARQDVARQDVARPAVVRQDVVRPAVVRPAVVRPAVVRAAAIPAAVPPLIFARAEAAPRRANRTGTSRPSAARTQPARTQPARTQPARIQTTARAAERPAGAAPGGVALTMFASLNRPLLPVDVAQP